ncbi:Dyp-type peroxidase [Phenylobacterium sp.]|uniref:Dyp-type peroxidase n=1 Tax=Phenylobacterium sp. TaxID=1871053 RepID=UPI0035644AD5
MADPITETADIQGILKSGYGPLTESTQLLLRVRDPAKARAWLAKAKPTSIADLEVKVPAALHVAISAPGLRALGLAEAVVRGFSPEFVSGMAADAARSRRLGDVGPNAPEHWDWGTAAWEPHLLVMLFAEPGGLGPFRAGVVTPAFKQAFEVRELAAATLDGNEPFGFVDGISQPQVDWAAARTPSTADDLDYGNQIAAGEFVLGYANEYGRITNRPLLNPGQDAGGMLPRAPDAPDRADLGRNGSYLVLRQLDQDVRGFWRFAAANGGQPLAEAMVGRRLDGQPLVAASSTTIRGVGPKADDVRLNSFDFDSDQLGLACPFTGHIRRANPRTGDLPGGDQGLLKFLLGMLGLGVDRRADTIASSRFHRLLRRGRKYGQTLSPAEAADPAAPDPKAGLLFVSLSANIQRQFEFVQGAWLASAKFGGLTGEQDPLLGVRLPFPGDQRTDGFRQPQAAGPCREIEAMPQFIRMRGGGYFFLPGLRALKFIAAGGA